MSGSPPLQTGARPSEMTSGEIWARMDISAAAFGQREAPKRRDAVNEGTANVGAQG